MDWIMFVVGIASGLISSTIVIIIHGTIKGWIKPFQKFVPANIRKSIKWEYKNHRKAEKSIAADIKTSETMRVFCLKGATFCNEYISRTKIPYKTLHENASIKQRYLISCPENPYISRRAEELSENCQDYKNAINTCINHLEKENKASATKVAFSLHQEVVRFRLYIFDKNLYLSYQPTDAKGSDCPVQKYPKESSGYKALKDYFDALWLQYSGEKIDIE
ncbi:MAG: hypothetical protein FWE13_05410 [Firmicutes bacterium]|nr:hypothetical protein [Bacillota bacterium]